MQKYFCIWNHTEPVSACLVLCNDLITREIIYLTTGCFKSGILRPKGVNQGVNLINFCFTTFGSSRKILVQQAPNTISYHKGYFVDCQVGTFLPN